MGLTTWGKIRSVLEIMIQKLVILWQRLVGRYNPPTPTWKQEANNTGLKWKRMRLTKEKFSNGWGCIEGDTFQMYT